MVNINRKNSNGITLVSLVVTIIILIILAGISISMLMGKNGLIEKAVKAKENTIIGEEKETISIAYTTLVEEKIENGEEITTEKFEKELKKLNKESKVSTDSQENFVIEISNTKNKYKIDKDKNITYIEGNAEDNIKKPYIETIEFTAGEDLENLGFEEYCTDSTTRNDSINAYKEYDGFCIGGAWANGYGYLMSLKKYDFSEIEKIEVGAYFGANSSSCINTFSVGLCSNNEKNNEFDEDLKTSVKHTGLTTCYKKNINIEDIETVSFDTIDVSNEYYIKICEDHGPTPSAMTTEARVFWIKIYYSNYKEGTVKKFTYKGNYEEYTVPETGKYKIECYGARGGCDNWTGTYLKDYGLGGYAAGTIELTKGEKLYIYVGQTGANGVIQANQLTSTSFNGGGAGIGSSDNDDGGGAGRRSNRCKANTRKLE